MICLAIGLGALGFFAMRRARRCHGFGPRFGHFGHYGHWHHHWHRGHWGERRWMMHALLARLDASPAQERAIIAEAEKLHERLHGAKRNLKDARGDLSAAVRGAVLDEAALGAVLGRVDASTAEARAAMIDALRSVHAVLDDGQRARLADMLDQGGGGFWRSGPYR
ncbi:MAG: Spy/CpxP family protein refolding chaperone [Kofleriaceae bacterium]|nr:Spy/CpxP family protein refolding chaperone [Kofleriaceae bacterium]